MKAEARNRGNEPSSRDQRRKRSRVEIRPRSKHLALIRPSSARKALSKAKSSCSAPGKFAGARSPQPDDLDKLDSHYMMCAFEGFRSRNTTEALLATHAAMTHELAMQQAAKMSRAKYLEESEFAQRAYVELSHLFFEQVNAINKIQNTQNNHINIGTVSVENGSQANIGCMTNASAIEARSPEHALENRKTSDPQRPRRRRATST